MFLPQSLALKYMPEVDLEPNPKQLVKKITLFRSQVLKETLVLWNIKPWVYEALLDER